MSSRFFVCLLMCMISPSLIRGQESPTEREAAREVLQKMASLEASLDVPSLVSRLTMPDAARDEVVARARELMDKDLLLLSDDITRNPEIGFQERRTIQKLGDYLKQHQFDVQVGVARLDTAFVARYRRNNGTPTLGVIVEYDALRGTERPFHGCQHSAQGPVGIAAAIAMAEYLERSKAPGSIVVFGTPGEEMMPPNAKVDMFEAGVFNGADVIVRSHSSQATSRPAPGFGTCCLNIDGVKYTFSGAPAHQMTPWNGRNALEAVIHLFNNIDSIRSSLRPEARIQGIISEGGAAPNVVPDRTVADFYVRYPDEVYLRQVRQFVDDAARAAALSTQTKVKIDHYGKARDGISVAALNELGYAYMKMFGGTKVAFEPAKPQGYEETGAVSSAIPGAELTARTSDGATHTYDMEADALRPVGHRGFVVDAQAMAALLYDFATHPEYRTAVKKEFDGIKALFGEYVAALERTYAVPKVAEPK